MTAVPVLKAICNLERPLALSALVPRLSHGRRNSGDTCCRKVAAA